MEDTLTPSSDGDAGTEVEAVGSAEQAPVETAASSPDPNDYEARIRTDPEFALAEVKRQQSAASRASTKLQKAQLALQIAETLGNGDVEAGAQAALTELTKFRQLQQDPKMAALLQRALNGESVLDSFYDETQDDPQAQKLSQLQGTVARLQEQLAETRVEKSLSALMEHKLVKHLTTEEKDEFIRYMDGTVRSWIKTPQGRENVEKMTPDILKNVLYGWMDQRDLFERVGERGALGRAERVRQFATDGPGRSTQIGPDGPPQNATNQQAWEYAMKKVLGR